MRSFSHRDVLSLPAVLSKTIRLASAVLLAVVVGVPDRWESQSLAQEITFLEGHTAPVYAVAVSPDGKTFVTASFDRTIRVWDATTRETIRTIKDTDQITLSLAVSPDGRQFAAGGFDEAVRIYDLPFRAPTGAFTGLSGNPSSLVTSPDGKLVVSGDDARVVRLWNGETGVGIRNFPGVTEVITGVAFNSDYTQVLATSKDGYLRGWKADDGAVSGTILTTPSSSIAFLHELSQAVLGGTDGVLRKFQWPPVAPLTPPGHGGAVTGVAISPDGKWIISAGADQKVQFAEVADPTKSQSLSGQSGPVTALSTADAYLATSSNTGLVQIWKFAAEGKDAAVHQAGLAGHTGSINDLAFRADGQQFATAGQDGTVRIWNRPEPARSIEAHTKPVPFVLRAADGKQIITASDDKRVVGWNLADGKPTFELKETPSPTALAASPDGKQLALGDVQGLLHLIPQAEGLESQTVIGAHLGKLTGIAYHPEKALLYTVGEDGTSKAWSLAAVTDATLATTDKVLDGVAISADGAKVLLTARDGQVQFIDLQGKVLASIEAGTYSPSAVAATPDLGFVILGESNGRATALTGEKLTPSFSVGSHTGGITDVAIHPEQKQFATTGADGLVRLWHLPIEPAWSIAGLEKGVNVAVLSPDDARLATGGADLKLQLSNVADGKTIASVETQAGTSSAAFSADGKLLAVGNSTGTITLLDGEKGTVVGTIAGHRKAVAGVSFDPQGKWLASGGSQGLLKYWQLPFTASQEIDLPDTAVAQAVSADGNLAAVASAQGIYLVDVPGGKVTRTIATTGKISALAISPDKATLAALDSQGSVAFYKVADGAPLGVLESGVAGSAALDFRADAPQVATSGSDGVVRLWKVPAAEMSIAAAKQPIAALVASPDGKTLATASDKSIALWSAADGKAIRTLAGHTGAVVSIAFNSDGTQIASAGTDKLAKVYNVADGKPLHEFTAPGPLTAAALSADGKTLATGSADGKVLLWPLDAKPEADKPIEPKVLEGHTAAVTAVVYVPSLNEWISASKDKTLQQWKVDGTNVRKIDAAAPVTSLALSPDGTKVAAAGEDGNLRLWESASGKSIVTFGEQKTPLTSIGFTQDGLAVLAGVGDQALLWDLTGQLLEKFTTAKQNVRGVALLPSASLLPPQGATGPGVVLAGADGTVRLRDRASAQVLSGHAGAVQTVQFVPKAAQLISGGADKTIRLWNLADGKELRQFAGCTDIVHSVAMTPDGTKLLAGSADKNIRKWNVADAKLEVTLPLAQAVEQVTVSVDGTRFVSRDAQNGVQVWDLAQALPLEQFNGFAKGFLGVNFGPAPQLLVASQAKVCDKLPIHALQVVQADTPGDAAQVEQVVVTAAGQVLTSGADKKVKLWDAAGKLVREYTGAAEVPGRLAVDNTNKLVAGAAGKKLHLWNLDNGQAVKTWDIPQTATAVGFVPAEKLVVVASADRVRVQRHTDDLLLEELLPGLSVNSMAVANKGRMLVLAGKEGKVSIDTRRLAHLLTGHTGEVTSLAYSADGTQIASGGIDKSVRLWKTDDGATIRAITGHTDAVTDVAYGTAGVVSLGKDKTLRVWNPANGAAVQTITLPMVASKMAVNAAATRATLAATDNQVYVWDLASGKPVERFLGHEGAVQQVAATADGEKVVSISADKTARLWNNRVQQFVVADAARAHAVAVLPDGSGWLTSGDDRIVKLWNAESDKPVRQFSGAATAPARLTVSADGQRVAAGGDPLLASKEFLVWNTADAKLLQKTATPGAVTSIAFQPDGNLLAVGSSDSHVYLQNVDTPLLWENITSAQPVNQLAFVDSHTLALGSNDGQLRMQDVAIRKVLTGHTGAVNSIAYAPDGKTLITGGTDKLVKLWNPETGEAIARNFAGPTTTVTGLDVSADGVHVAAASGPTAFMWKLADGALVRKLEPGGNVQRLKFSPDSTRLALGTSASQTTVYDVAAGHLLQRYLGHSGTIMSVNYGLEVPDGLPLLVSGATDNKALVQTPSCLGYAKVHEGPITAVAAAADGSKFYTVGEDKKVQSIATGSLQVIGTFAGSQAPQRAVVLSTDGKFLAAGGDDRTLRVWDTSSLAATGDAEKPAAKPIDPLAQQQLPSTVSALAITSGGEQVIAAGADQIIRNFHLSKSDDGTTLALMQTEQGHTARVGGLALAADDHTLFSVSDDKTFKRWYNALADARQVLKGHEDQIFNLTYSPDGTLLAGASADKTVRLWNLVRREPGADPAADKPDDKEEKKDEKAEVAPEDRPALVTCEGHTGQVFAVAFSPDSKQLASCGLDRTVRFWSLDGKEVKSITEGIKDGLYCLSYSPDGKSLAAAGLGGVWHQWTLGEEDKLAFSAVGHSYPIYALVYNAAGTRVATLDYSGNLFVWNNTGGNPRHHQQLPVFAGYCVRYLPDGTSVLLGTQDPRGMVLSLPPTAR